MGLIVDGVDIPTKYECLNWITNPREIKNVVTVGKHGKPRPPEYPDPLGVCLHNFTGTRKLIVESAPRSEARSFAVARMFANPNGRKASCHLIVTAASRVLQLADLKKHTTFHAGMCNGWSLGIESQKDKDYVMTEPCIDTTVDLCIDLANIFNIPKVIPADDRDPFRAEDKVIASINKTHPYYGFFGHRNCSVNRGPGDPGDVIFERLLAKGWTLKKY